MSKCYHQWTNVGFTVEIMACKLCGILKQELKTRALPANPFRDEIKPTPCAGVMKMRTLRGMTELLPLLSIVDQYGGVIAGGYARYAAGPNPHMKVGDVDIFPQTEQAFKGIISELKERGFDSFGSTFCTEMAPPKFRRDYDPRHAHWASMPLKVQIVKTHCIGLAEPKREKTKEEFARFVLDSFDMINVRAAILDVQTALVDAGFWKQEFDKQLAFVGFRSPSMLFKRLEKYVGKGYTADAKAIMDLLGRHPNLTSFDIQEFQGNVNNAIKFGREALKTRMKYGMMDSLWVKSPGSSKIEDSGAYEDEDEDEEEETTEKLQPVTVNKRSGVVKIPIAVTIKPIAVTTQFTNDMFKF